MQKDSRTYTKNNQKSDRTFPQEIRVADFYTQNSRKGQVMFKIFFAVALLWATYHLDLNQDCDGYICQVEQSHQK